MESHQNTHSGGANPGDSEIRNKRSRDATPFSFQDWSTVLAAADLPDKEKTSFEIAIRWYLGFCSRSRSRASFASAKAFIETVTRERNPEPYQVESWRNALRWFFRNAEGQEGGGQPLL